MPMKLTRKTRSSCVRRAALAAAIGVMASVGTYAAQPPAPDNTKVNARDRQPAQPTADDQKNNRTDLQMTQAIRKALRPTSRSRPTRTT